MPNDRVAHTIGLILRTALLEDEVSRNDRALELERHLRRREEAIRRADVVQEAREVVRLAVVRPAREVSFHERGAFPAHISQRVFGVGGLVAYRRHIPGCCDCTFARRALSAGHVSE